MTCRYPSYYKTSLSLGMLYANRYGEKEKSSNGYRFGFQSQMKDNEIYGEGNSYTADYWEYDPRTCRRWNVDPMTKEFSHQSPYCAFDNNPVYYKDPFGMASEGHGGDGQKIDETTKNTSSSSLLAQVVNNKRYANMKGESTLKGTTTTGSNTNTSQNSNPISVTNGTLPSNSIPSSNGREPSQPITTNANTPEYIKTAGDINGTVGVGVSVVENTAGISRVGSNLKVYTATQTGRVFYGNQYVSTVGITKVAKILGPVGLAIGTGIDAVGVNNYYTNGEGTPNSVHPAKAGLNLGVGVWSLATGPAGAVGGAFYFGIDAFYPGGWRQALIDQNTNYEHNKAIDPTWRMFPGPLKQ